MGSVAPFGFTRVKKLYPDGKRHYWMLEEKKDEASNIDTFLKKSVQENVDKNGIFKVGYVEASIYLSYGGDAFVQDEKGNTLAHIYPQLTEKLIEKGVDINQKNDEGYTPAMCAAIKIN